jgi:hypothetical protein
MENSKEYRATKARDYYHRLAAEHGWPKNMDGGYFPIPLTNFLKLARLLVSKVHAKEIQLADIQRMIEYQLQTFSNTTL